MWVSPFRRAATSGAGRATQPREKITMFEMSEKPEDIG
jgi:hypothetical protein